MKITPRTAARQPPKSLDNVRDRIHLKHDSIRTEQVSLWTTHLAIPDHSKRFWLTVQSLCPETERARQWLCANGARLYMDFKPEG